MKQYEFIHLRIDRFIGAESEKHRKVITDCAAAGWRYVGFIPTLISDYGKIKEMDLVFEKDI